MNHDSSCASRVESTLTQRDDSQRPKSWEKKQSRNESSTQSHNTSFEMSLKLLCCSVVSSHFTPLLTCTRATESSPVAVRRLPRPQNGKEVEVYNAGLRCVTSSSTLLTWIIIIASAYIRRMSHCIDIKIATVFSGLGRGSFAAAGFSNALLPDARLTIHRSTLTTLTVGQSATSIALLSEFQSHGLQWEC